MPIYDYECIECGADRKDEFVHSWESVVLCENCGSEMNRKFPDSFVFQPWPADGLFLKHVCPEGKTFMSKRELQSYAKEHDLELGAL